MEKMLINERFKSPNKEFEKVYILFNKKDYFDENSQVKKKQEEFARFLKKGDPMATKVFKQHKEDMKSSLSFIEDMVRDYNKKNHFEAFQLFSKAVNDIEMKDSKSAERSGNFIKSKIHNNSQKYSLAIYTAIRKQKFNNYKDVHKDVDELTSKNESVEEATFRPNSGTMSGGTYGLDKRKYELKRDVKGVKIGDYTNVTLPKGTIIYNLPGGVFAHHRSLKSYEAGMNKYFNKPTFRGISIRREKNVILSIEKNSKILESVNEASAINRLNSVQDAREKMASYISFKKANNLNKKDAWFDKIEKTLLKKSYRDLEKLYLKLGGKRLTIKESVVTEGNLKLSSSAKKFWNTSSKKLFGFSGSNPYDNVPPSQWNTHPEIIDGYGKNAGADIFKGFIRDKISGNGHLDSKVAKMIGLPTNVSIIDYLSDGGSGLNGNKNFKRFNNWSGALYDIYEEMEKKFGKVKVESVPQGYNPMVEDKNQIKDLVKKVKHEKLFYDVLNTMEKKFGKNKYRIWLEKSLKGFGVNPKHYDYRTNAGAEEKLFQLGK